jgi:hypothetical protein
MPAGQAHNTWFPELKDILKERWNSKLTIEQHFDIVNDLNNKLTQIRKDLNIGLISRIRKSSFPKNLQNLILIQIRISSI